MVIIDDIEPLKQWLVKKLSPVCDADPNALAKYVIALIRKDKSDDDLKTLCYEQLDVFLQKETGQFVESLFEVLESKCYERNQPDSTTSSEVRPSDPDIKENLKEGRVIKPVVKSPSRFKQKSPDTGRRRPHEDRDRRHRRRSPMPENRRHFGRRARSRSNSPHRRSFRQQEPLHRRLQRLASPKRSRSPCRKRSRSMSKSLSPSIGRHGSNSDGSSVELVTTKQEPSHEIKKKERCWDYDQKGFCMKGDQCLFDHGEDAVVVDDLTITSSSNQSLEPKSSSTDTKVTTVTAPPPPVVPLPIPIPPTLLHHRMSVPPPHLMHRFPPPPFNINVPPPNFVTPPVITSTTLGTYNPEVPAINHQKQDPTLTSNDLTRKRSAVDGVGGEPGTKRTFTNANTTGHGNRTLIVKKIPPILNNIAKLNEHFAKFGSINNIQVKYEFQPNQALIEFAHPSSAKAAIRDTEAILNNRFIRVYWFNAAVAVANDEQHLKDGTNGNSSSVKDRIGSLPTLNQLKYTAPGVNQNKATTLNGGVIQRTISNPDADKSAKTSQHDSSHNELTDKVATLEAKKRIIGAQQAAKQKAIQQKNLVLKRKFELNKQRQGLLKKQLDQQKILLAKLECKTMQPNEKIELIKTLKILTSSIDSLRQVTKKAKSVPQIAEEKQKQTQKELLDAELDLYNASTNGENTSLLKKKLSQLKVEASSLGLVTAYRGSWLRGRGGGLRGGGLRGRTGRGRGNIHRFIKAGANIDRRPCEIRISGFFIKEKEEIITHFADFGEIETFSFDEDDLTCTVKYKNRYDAEQAASQGSSFKTRNLIIVWTSQPHKLPIAVAQASSIPPQSQSLSPAHLQEAKDKSDKERVIDDEEDDEISVVVDPVAVYTPPEEDDEYGYGGLLEEELDEEALLAGAELEDEEETLEEERSWRH